MTTTAPDAEPALPQPLRLTADELDAAIAVVRRHFAPTPQYEWPMLCEAVGVRVTVKHENHLPVGAFKVRGGVVYAERLLRRRPDVAGLVSATRGNHGQSLAFAGRLHGFAVTIFVPHGNSAEKNAAMRALGAEVVEHGCDFQEAREASRRYAADHGLEIVQPFERDLVAGVATYAAELFAAVDDIDTLYVPVGMGSGINACIAVRDLLGLRTRVVGVVATGAPATALSFEARRVVPTDAADTLVDGVATRAPDPVAVAGIVAGADDVIRVDDDAVAAAMRTIYTSTHNVAEPAGAIGLAGMLADGPERRGDHAAFVLTGGNVDADVFARVLAGGSLAPG